MGASSRFAEALLLCAVGAVVGLMVARFVLARAWTMIEEQTGPLPFWIDTSVSSTTILYAAGLTLFAAAIAGVVPAVKVTLGGVDGRLRAASSGGGGLQFGGVWTVVIVAQIALTTMLPVPLIGVGADVTRKTPAGFPAEAFLTATLAIDRFDGVAASGDTVPAVRVARLEASCRALADRLRQEPGVLDVTYADQMPLMRTRWRGIEMDPGPAAQHSRPCRSCAGVVSGDPRFFDVVAAPVIRGRALTTADAEHRTRAVLVNEFFVDHVMGGHNPIGRRVRFLSTREPTAESWYDIVGVVPDLGVSDNRSDYGRPRIYHATLPKETGPLRVAIHVRGDPQLFAVRLRELAQATDPALRVIDPKPMPRLAESVSTFWMVTAVFALSTILCCALACIVPTRRALRIQPTEALRDER
ncbi:hypothetical protein BH23GEM3_BH23GEM3_00310 [soil metagenome]